jgi:hypothetical protein
VEAVKAFCRSKSDEAATVVYRLMLESESEKVRLAAALGILKIGGAMNDQPPPPTINLIPSSTTGPDQQPNSMAKLFSLARQQLTNSGGGES